MFGRTGNRSVGRSLCARSNDQQTARISRQSVPVNCALFLFLLGPLAPADTVHPLVIGRSTRNPGFIITVAAVLSSKSMISAMKQALSATVRDPPRGRCCPICSGLATPAQQRCDDSSGMSRFLGISVLTPNDIASSRTTSAGSYAGRLILKRTQLCDICS